ncbi:Fatty acyl-CoA reductase [Ooceraea biroi]|uniref:Fatty acyl-CoA reductase n=1 Tax=Ooceraea biroi TaxID=2015173 RepID=A0A026VSC1_OOCBI|nr:Fatty acyl-CoA reductase [Ooceraea biroi]
MIEEKFYDSPMDSDKLIALMECVEDKLAEDITPQLLGKWPNTYTYTKAVAENAIKKHGDDLPVGIFRPAIGSYTFFLFYNIFILKIHSDIKNYL